MFICVLMCSFKCIWAWASSSGPPATRCGGGAASTPELELPALHEAQSTSTSKSGCKALASYSMAFFQSQAKQPEVHLHFPQMPMPTAFSLVTLIWAGAVKSCKATILMPLTLPIASQSHRPTDTNTHKPTDPQTHKPTDTQTHRLTHRHTHNRIDNKGN